MNKIIHGDSLEVLKKGTSDTIDCIVTDPPYGYSFMGKDWDKAVPSVDLWKECLRVLKPGGFAFVMSAPRQDVLSQMIVRLGEAGFNTSFTSLYWTYASGFPKAMNIGKMVDKRNGIEREVIGDGKPMKSLGTMHDDDWVSNQEYKETKGNSQLEGSYGGFQPKPAVEVIIVAMKPLSEKTYVDQALKNGKGITWLDDCRIPSETRFNAPATPQKGTFNCSFDSDYQGQEVSGRYPANLLVSDDVLNGEQEYSRYFDLDKWAETLPFLITPKASKSEKNKGLEEFEEVIRSDREAVENIGANNPRNRTGTAKKNHHPTVKPLKLMSYLITLGSREGDLILDPFVGSGTTCLAAKNLNRNYIGIEREEEYVKIAQARLNAPQNNEIKKK